MLYLHMYSDRVRLANQMNSISLLTIPVIISSRHLDQRNFPADWNPLDNTVTRLKLTILLILTKCYVSLIDNSFETNILSSRAIHIISKTNFIESSTR